MFYTEMSWRIMGNQGDEGRGDGATTDEKQWLIIQLPLGKQNIICSITL